MEGKVDQYGFPKMKNSQIIITEEVFIMQIFDIFLTFQCTNLKIFNNIFII